MERFIGKKLDGRYEIREIVGVGGMAVVYQAYDAIEEKTVAIKILKEEFLANEEFKRRFKNESKAIAMLSHPNIVKVYDVSLSDRLQYIVMEYIDGITLKEYIDQQKVLKWKETVHFIEQILKAMQHAHDNGIVHRDIKPQNIMLLADGAIKVTDFGIARFSRSETRTITDKAIGSVHYISPEQARGGYIDEKADIYSVGVMLYEMLTGKLPFEADSPVSVAIMQMQTNPKMPHTINDTIPEGLEQITMRAMQKDPAQRYQSAAEMLRDIEEFKKNPSIQFEYQYFIDETATKYVDAINQVKNTNDYEDYNNKRSPVIPILSGIAAAFVLIVAVTAGWFFYQTISPAAPQNETVEVPNLVGQKYDTVYADPRYRDYLVVESREHNIEYEAGVIFHQNPTSGLNIVLKEIKVKVSLGPKLETVPDVYEKTQADAEMILRDKGFEVTVIPEQHESIPSGMVIRTSPARNVETVEKTEVKLYVSKGKEILLVPVPNVLDLSLEKATVELEKSGLLVKHPVVEKDSPLEKGTVLEQGVEANVEVPTGTEIELTVSSGNKPDRTAVINIDFRNFNTVSSVTLDIFKDQVNTHTQKYTTSASLPFSFTGNEKTTIEFQINGQLYQRWSIDFTQESPVPVLEKEKTVVFDD